MSIFWHGGFRIAVTAVTYLRDPYRTAVGSPATTLRPAKTFAMKWQRLWSARLLRLLQE